MPELKLDEIIQLSKIGNFLKEKSEDEQLKKTLKIVLICVGAVVLLAAAAYAVYRILHRYDDEYDLYDDLDYYYDENEANADDPDAPTDKDFAE
ncbi:MAG: hypothetical protein E7233_11865 [Lachnospiraceae bacterium]|nr:hypothetical protein [Lachnospiraceae bacterium]